MNSTIQTQKEAELYIQQTLTKAVETILATLEEQYDYDFNGDTIITDASILTDQFIRQLTDMIGYKNLMDMQSFNGNAITLTIAK